MFFKNIIKRDSKSYHRYGPFSYGYVTYKFLLGQKYSQSLVSAVPHLDQFFYA